MYIMEKNGRLDAVAYRFVITLNDDELDNIEYVYITEKARDNLSEKLLSNIVRTGDKITDEKAEYKAMYDAEDIVQEQYFTQDKINELKLRFIKYIVETPNPFSIYCNDTDAYPVPAYRIFDINVNVNPDNNKAMKGD